MPVSHGFTVTKNLTGTPAYNSWSEFQHDSTLLSQSDLVHAIAEHIMDNWFGGTPATLKAWQDKLSGTPHADAAIQQHLSDIVQSNLRLPGDPPILVKKGPRKGLENLDHLEGLVAEHLWHMCAAESALGAAPRFLGDLGFRVHDKGPDGFVIVDSAGRLEYRLWEVKKNSTSLPATATVTGAAQQLHLRATDYLQEIAQLNRHNADPQLKSLFQQLVYFWGQQSPEANAGIAVVTTRPSGATTPFTHFGSTYLSGFKGTNPMQGLLVNMNDLSRLATDVRQEIWNGL